MLLHCISAIVSLGIMLVGILVILQVVQLKDVVKALGRGLLPILVVPVVLCLLGTFASTALAVALGILRHLLVWVLMIGAGIAFVGFGAWFLGSKSRAGDLAGDGRKNRETLRAERQTDRF